ncbi:TrbJ/VirB5 family protein [Pectobacterium versatile]|uniref:type IV secretion system protein n=1 Tax=Pectobacterium versatile TaxID=2488639 RepID=UPI000DAB36FD|nr:type IV secretion system protein [Pectobacterium versatile]GBO48484.1 hypothetical protein MFFDBJGM_01496 [Pectobacterium versatile]
MPVRHAMLALSLFIALPAIGGGIPVFDTIQNAESIRQWTQELKQWEETVTHYKSQLDAYQKQLATATGIRDIQGFLSETRNLKTDIDALRKNGISLDTLLTQPDGGYSSALNTLYDKYQAFNVCNPANTAGDYQAICRQIVLNQALVIENTRDVETRIGNALNDIALLSARITDAKDTKESQDLANAIAARSVQLNVLTHQWEMTVKQAGQRATLLEQQRRQAFDKQQATAPIPDFNH